MINTSHLIDFNDDNQYVDFLRYYVDSYYDKLEILFENILDNKNNIKKNKETILKLLITIHILNKYNK